MKDFVPGSFGCHELLHSLSIFSDIWARFILKDPQLNFLSMFADIWARFILEHPSCQQNDQWREKADKILANIYDLFLEENKKDKIGQVDQILSDILEFYQEVGNTHLQFP